MLLAVRPLLLFVCLLGVAGCGFPEFAVTPGDGGTVDGEILVNDGTDSAGGVDDTALDGTPVRADTADTAVADRAGDTSITKTDSAPIDTAVVDSAREAEAATPVGCADRTELFCVDWDTTASPEAPFDNNKQIVTPGEIGLETTNPISPPNRFYASVGPGAASIIEARVFKAFTSPATGTEMRADLWLQVDSASFPTINGEVVLVKLEPSGVGDGVTLSMDNGGFFVNRIGIDYQRYFVAYRITPNRWIHVRMDVVLKTTGGLFRLWMDDMTKPLVDKVGISTATSDTNARMFNVGLFAQNPTGVFKARFDDVTFTFK
jgi:hypothetical protein